MSFSGLCDDQYFQDGRIWVEGNGARRGGERARDADAPSIGLTDIQRWLADQPPLAANANAEESKDAGEAATKPANATLEKEMVWRRSVQRVLQRFVRRAEYGRSQALKAAGVNAANALGFGYRIGRIAPGSAADLVIVDGDPLANIGDALRIVGIVRNGRFFSVSGLLERAGTAPNVE